MIRMADNWPSYRPNSPGLAPPEHDSVRRERVRVAMRGLIAVALARAPDKDLYAAMSELCTVAHKEQIQMEQVLIVLRAEWDSAEKPPMPLWNTLENIRAKLVKDCIEQFYENIA